MYAVSRVSRLLYKIESDDAQAYNTPYLEIMVMDTFIFEVFYMVDCTTLTDDYPQVGQGRDEKMEVPKANKRNARWREIWGGKGRYRTNVNLKKKRPSRIWENTTYTVCIYISREIHTEITST